MRYTFDSYAGHDAMVARLPDHFDMSLNQTDMRIVLRALHVMMTSDDVGQRWQDLASVLYGSFAETLGIELI